MKDEIGIVGAGAWGTALAINAAASGKKIKLWGREGAAIHALETSRIHSSLPAIYLERNILVSGDIDILRSAGLILLTVPAQQLRGMVRQLAIILSNDVPLVICAKGLELDSGKPMAQVVAEELPNPGAVLSGPTFAAEMARNLPTAATLAALDETLARNLSHTLSNASFRLYHTTDIVGVEIGGALKNVVAIACGIVIGKGLGENARAALMTRGLAEITRLSVKLGGRPETLMGLSGLGDLSLTCASPQSRNFSFGLKLGEGASPLAAASGALIEGAATAQAALTLANEHGIDMPIAAAVQAILSGASVEDIMAGLMTRPLKTEYK